MNPRIARLELFRFRSHLRCLICPGDRHVILSGRNGSGKTSILEAISFCSPGRGLRNARTDEISRQPDNHGWRVEVGIAGNANTTIRTWCDPGDTSRKLSINDKPARQLDLANWIRALWLIPAMDRLWTDSVDRRRRFLDRMTMSIFPDHPVHVNSYDKALRERNRLLRDNVMDDDWLTSIEFQMAESGAAVSRNRRRAIDNIRRAFGEAAMSFPTTRLSIVQQPSLEEVSEDINGLATLFRAGRSRDAMAGRSLAGPHRVDMTAAHAGSGRAAVQCSTGEQKAMLIAIFIANARAVSSASGESPLLLLDEAAAHLDLGLRKALLDEIHRLESQVWITCTEIGELMLKDHRAQHLCLDGTGEHNVTLSYAIT